MTLEIKIQVENPFEKKIWKEKVRSYKEFFELKRQKNLQELDTRMNELQTFKLCMCTLMYLTQKDGLFQIQLYSLVKGCNI